ncbi:hypothetical protein FACS1894159_04140 [Bacteroidia bacterium]|nr:hypothetical protein FACS1894159_04140 [Bacteroidia bacterium]
MRRIIVVLLLTLPAVAVRAQPRQLQEHTARAVELYQAQKYLAARGELQKARESLDSDPRCEPYRATLDYYAAMCAAQNDERDAMALLEEFLDDHPGSTYSNDIRFALAGQFYHRHEWARARNEYLGVNPVELGRERQGCYYYYLGYCYFALGEMDYAYRQFVQCVDDDTFGVHARYHLSHIEYARGNYTVSADYLRSIESNELYAKVAPYYLLQIEFMLGHYDNVVANGIRIANPLSSERAARVARMMAESYYRLGDNDGTLRNIAIYRQSGAEMGRDDYYLLGFAEYRGGNVGAAAEALARVVGPDDKLSQNASHLLGDCYLQLGDKRAAMQSFSIAASDDAPEPVREDALYNYGKLVYELGGGLFSEAINVLSRYLHDYPSASHAAQAREYLAAAYYNSHDYAAAYDQITKLPNPDNNIKAAIQKIAYFRALECYNQRDYARTQQLLEQSASYRINQKYNALATYYLGEVYYKQERYQDAATLLRNYISVAPSSEREYAMAHYALGYCNYNLGRWDDSRQWFDRFLAVWPAPDNYRADALNRLGDLRCQARDFNGAVASYEKTITVGVVPERYYAQFNRAMAFGYGGRTQRKIDALKDITLAGQGPYIDQAQYELARALIVAERFPDAIGALRSFMDDYPGSVRYVDALGDMGLAQLNTGNRAEALRYYKLLVEKAPASPLAREAVASIRTIYVDMGDTDAYFAYARQSGVETDMSVVRRDSLSWEAALRVWQRDQKDKGAVAMRGYLDAYPKGQRRAEALCRLGQAQADMGDENGAVASLEELSAMYANDFTVRGLGLLAGLYLNKKDYPNAARCYLRLTGLVDRPEDRDAAWEGYLTAVAAQGDDRAVVAAADRALASPPSGERLRIRALYARARACDELGEKTMALESYTALSAWPRSAEGAEASSRVIRAAFERGDMAQVKQRTLALADSSTPYSYYLAEAFLTLGDMYAAENDRFQARATYQSVVNGYAIPDDGIIDRAKERIKNMK